MFTQNLRSKAHRLVGNQRPIGEHVKGQLVVVSNLAYTRVVHSDIDSLNRRINGINRYHAYGKILTLVPVSTDITASFGNSQLHVKLGILAAQMCDHQIRIQNFNVLISLNIGSMYNALSLIFDVRSLGFIRLTVIFDRKTLDIHNDLRHIFLDAGNRAEFMQHTLNLNLAHRRPGQGGKHNSSQRIAERNAVASFQRLNHKLSILLVF